MKILFVLLLLVSCSSLERSPAIEDPACSCEMPEKGTR